MGQVAEHNAQNQAIAGRNRAKLRNFEEQNRLYDRDVMFDRAQYRNDMQLEDIKQDDCLDPLNVFLWILFHVIILFNYLTLLLIL